MKLTTVASLGCGFFAGSCLIAAFKVDVGAAAGVTLAFGLYRAAIWFRTTPR